jgi:hypothetical protein
MKEITVKLSLTDTEANETLGDELGDMARDIVGNSQVKRLVIAGGDTAGRIQQFLQIEALQVSKPIGIAAPLGYVYSKQPELNGLEMAFKGGQIGSKDYLYQAAQCARITEFEEVALESLKYLDWLTQSKIKTYPLLDSIAAINKISNPLKISFRLTNAIHNQDSKINISTMANLND